MLEAAFTMLSMDGSTCFHSLVFSPQSGLQQKDMSVLAAQNWRRAYPKKCYKKG